MSPASDPNPNPLTRTRLVPTDGARTKLTRAHGYALLAITALAAALRFLHLGEWSLWGDEAHTWRDATMPLDGFLDQQRAAYALPFLLLRGLLALGWIGEDPVSLRLPFALIGIATVPLLGLCGRRLIGAWPAVLAAGVLAVHPWHVYWSQNARGYVIVVLAAVVAVDRMFAFVRDERTRDVLAVWLAIALATVSHPTSFVLAFAFVAFLWLRGAPLDRGRLVRLVLGAGALALALPWLLQQSFTDFMRAKSTPSLLHLVQTTGFYFRPVPLLMAAVGLWQLRHVGGRDRVLALGCVAIAPFVVLAVVGSGLVLTTARYAICVLPVVTWLAAFAALQVAAAVQRAPGLGRPLRLLAAGVLPALLVLEHARSLGDYYTIEHGQRARWSEAAEFLRARADGRPLRVATINYPTMLYYLKPGFWSNRVPREFVENRVTSIEDWMIRGGVDQNSNKVCEPGAANHLDWHRRSARDANSLFAFVVTLPELAEKDPDNELLDAIRAECHLVLHLPCWVGPKDESLYVFTLKEP